MAFRDIITNRKGRAGSNGSWEVVRVSSTDDRPEYALWHYRTKMLHWVEVDGENVVLDWNLGYGSVSDQQGLNIAFRLLALPFYYTRANGGPTIAVR